LDAHYGQLSEEENYKLGFYIATMVSQLLASGLQHLQPLYEKYQEYLVSDSQEIDMPVEEKKTVRIFLKNGTNKITAFLSKLKKLYHPLPTKPLVRFIWNW
jgi:hypothetical protein